MIQIEEKKDFWNCQIHHCQLCPRQCGVDRTTQQGFCASGPEITAGRAALHHWEEPCISGSNGSGTVFFSGCTLRCCFCQNHSISQEGTGIPLTAQRLGEIFLSLQNQGAHNLNLVTPTHFLPWIIPALDQVRSQLRIPIVYNCGGYESTETIQALADYVDIWIPDLKYYDPALSQAYSHAENYFSVASEAIGLMILKTGPPVFQADLLQRGVIIRHMVLPGQKADSLLLLNWMSKNLPKGQFLISLLSQYTPSYQSPQYPELNRKITSYEYNFVVEAALKLGLDQGFMQEKSSAKSEYTPSFDMKGL